MLVNRLRLGFIPADNCSLLLALCRCFAAGNSLLDTSESPRAIGGASAAESESVM